MEATVLLSIYLSSKLILIGTKALPARCPLADVPGPACDMSPPRHLGTETRPTHNTSESSLSPVLPFAPPPSIVLDTLTLAPATLSYTTCPHPLRQVLSSALLPTSHTSSRLHDNLPSPTHTHPAFRNIWAYSRTRFIIHRSLPLGRLRVEEER